jgi:hypothetical protein
MWGNVWEGSTVIVLASGPSLTEADVELVRQWKEGGNNRYVIVTNTTYQMALWADALFFHDLKWWKMYRDDVRARFAGRVVTVASVNDPDVDWLRRWDAYNNSGAGSMALAALAGAVRVIGLGVDCKYTDGRRHWHGDHPPGLGNARAVKKWETHYARLKRNHASIEMMNASRDTDLKALPRVLLEDALCST